MSSTQSCPPNAQITIILDEAALKEAAVDYLRRNGLNTEDKHLRVDWDVKREPRRVGAVVTIGGGFNREENPEGVGEATSAPNPSVQSAVKGPKHTLDDLDLDELEELVTESASEEIPPEPLEQEEAAQEDDDEQEEAQAQAELKAAEEAMKAPAKKKTNPLFMKKRKGESGSAGFSLPGASKSEPAKASKPSSKSLFPKSSLNRGD